jgi:hypothetical protein
MNFTKAKNKIDKSDEKRVLVTKFKRRHFKKNLSTSMGFGFQDMRKTPKNLLKNLTCQGYEIELIPLSIGMDNVEVELYVNK